MENAQTSPIVPQSSIATISAGLERRRQLKDRLANIIIVAGGMFVIVAIALIFFYLLYEVLPLFKGADLAQTQRYASAPAASYASGQPEPACGRADRQRAARRHSLRP